MIGPCGGFVRTYKCLSSFYNAALASDITWDVDNLFEPNNNRSFNFGEFILPSSNQGYILY